MNSKFVIISVLIIVVSILAVLAVDSVNLDKLCAEKGGVRNEDGCLIQVTPSDESISEQIESVTFDNITIMGPNSVEFFYYPPSLKDKDTY